MNTGEAALNAFARRHGIAKERFSTDLASGASCLEQTWDILDQASRDEFDRLASEPSWGLLRTMLKREQEYAAASFVVQASGFGAGGEILARSVVEAAVNFLYILKGDRFQRLHDYFSSYIATERSQNKTWGEAARRGPVGARALQAKAIARKEHAMDLLEAFLQQCFVEIGRTYVPGAKWPTVFDRFKEIGKETSYRTVYAALCSQTHNDPEDLLNEFVVKLTGDKGLVAKLEAETDGFGKFSVLVGLQYHMEAVAAYVRAFDLQAAFEPIGQLYTLASHLAETAAMESDFGRDLMSDSRSGPA